MKIETSYEVAIVGAGIVGLAHAWHLAKAGKRVAVFEKSPRAVGASIRNFGMIWPIGQPPGEMREIALDSRAYWLEMLEAAKIWHRQCGSLHLAYERDEMEVLREFAELGPELGYVCRMTSAHEALTKSPPVRPDRLKGALWNPEEMCVFPRQVIGALPEYLASELGVKFHFSAAITEVESGRLVAGGKAFGADWILVCPGDDLGTLFSDELRAAGMSLCKLQMMRARPKTPFEIGAHLCAGLTLAHYANFKICKSLCPLKDRYARQFPHHVRWGVHVLVSQHEDGGLTIGDTHEYGQGHDPFESAKLDKLVLDYLDTFLRASDLDIIERWHGVYAKHPERPYVIESPCEGVTVVAALGGAGMTLSFGMAAKVIRQHGA